ncbi:MAG: rhodanese-like domain-containing protein [Blastocatellia bacterium]
MNLTTTFIYITLLTLLLLTGTGCLTTQSAVNDPPPPPPAPKPTVVATPSGQPTPAPSIPPDEYIQRTPPREAMRQIKAGQAILIDVRDKTSFENMHIKDASFLAFEDVVKGQLGNFPKDKHLIFYCTCIREHSAAQAAVIFQEKGYQKVSALKDGLLGYQQVGGEVVMKN